MRNLRLYFLIILISPFLLNCQGEQGPPGPAGRDGENAPETLAMVYETTFDLNVGNNWSFYFPFPKADIIYEADVVLVYSWSGTVDGRNIWQLMPISFFEPEGLLQMNFDHTLSDVTIFLDASFELTNVINFKGEKARIVVIPSYFSQNKRKGNIDFSNYEEVKKTYGLKEPQNINLSDTNK